MKLHETAVEAAVSAAGGVTPGTGPIVELARTLARQMDESGPHPGSRLVASYLTTIRALVAQLGPLIDERPRHGKLAQLRAESQRRPGGVTDLGVPDTPRGIVPV